MRFLNTLTSPFSESYIRICSYPKTVGKLTKRKRENARNSESSAKEKEGGPWVMVRGDPKMKAMHPV